MTENLGPLRQAMSDLAEHGGSSDLYERSLRRSRQTQRRARIAASSAVAVAVLAVGGAVGLLRPDADRPDPSPPVATPAPTLSPSTSPTSPAPSVSSPPATPGTKAPSSARTQYPDCPSGKTLEKLADLPADWSFPSSTVKCWRTWATAEPVGPDTGDGVYLFHYRSGSWRYHSQGSAFQCADLGITSGNPPFCGTD